MTTVDADLEYVTLAVGAFASWVGLPGPGEPLLIAAGILASRHKLSLPDVLAVAFLAATLGGIGGWLLGMKAGRGVLERKGPLYRLRLRALQRGEEVFERWPAVAVLLTTSWIAGIHRVRTTTYLVWNAIGAATWAAGIGIGAYLVGPPAIDVINDASTWLAVVGIGGLVVSIAALELVRHRRHGRGSGG